MIFNIRKLTIFLAGTLLTAPFTASVMAQQAPSAPEAPEAPQATSPERMARVQAELKAAEAELQAAAEKIARLSGDMAQRHANVHVMRFLTGDGDRASLGVMIEPAAEQAGVRVVDLTDEGPAQQAGLQAGDIIMSVNANPLDGQQTSTSETLLDILTDLEPGDPVTIEVLRDGQLREYEVITQRHGGVVLPEFDFDFDNIDFDVPMPHVRVGMAPNVKHWKFDFFGPALWRDLDLVELNPDLGEYFGTSDGLLVIGVPEDGELDLRGGDVIQSIDGRQVEDVDHAFRILRSYEPGETVRLDILRARQQRSLESVIPELQTGPHSGTIPEGLDKVERQVRNAVRAVEMRQRQEI